jgi:4-hydroxybenzoate polyprenyltransferase
MNQTKLQAFGRLTRPANLVTALADILAGGAVAFGLQSALAGPEASGDLLGWFLTTLPLLLLATLGLYGGGVVLNDVFDAELDALERPERPIPKGIVTVAEASYWGGGLLALGVVAAMWASATSGLIAACVAGLAVLYDAWSKHHRLLGPLNMGLCRGGNLLLGISVVPSLVPHVAGLMLIPVIYIAAITTVSRGEVHGGDRTNLQLATGMYALVILLVLTAKTLITKYFIAVPATGPVLLNFIVMVALLGLLAYFIYPPLLRALQKPDGKNVMKAVKAGVVSLIVLDAALAAGFAGLGWGLLILALLPLSRLLARIFAVT